MIMVQAQFLCCKALITWNYKTIGKNMKNSAAQEKRSQARLSQGICPDRQNNLYPVFV
jgi:hypothetical protein